jgi:hypothetical protein
LQAKGSPVCSLETDLSGNACSFSYKPPAFGVGEEGIRMTKVRLKRAVKVIKVKNLLPFAARKKEGGLTPKWHLERYH